MMERLKQRAETHCEGHVCVYTPARGVEWRKKGEEERKIIKG